MLVTLYTSRVVLAELGIVDYGIYNVVGSVIVMFSFISSSMSTSTQRFLTFELGRENYSRLHKLFAASLNVHIVLGFVIFLLGESVGLWFINTHLVIPPERLYSANVAYQSSVLAFLIGVTQVPYSATLIAHEKMDIYAYMSIVEALGKLGVAEMLTWYTYDKLTFYAVAVLLLQLSILTIYRIYCIKHYAECRFSLFWDFALYKKIVLFAGWNLFGSMAWLLRGQGLNILLNLFFGPSLNAAKGIADRVSSGVGGFVRSFNMALNPQITKNYATGEIEKMEELCFRGVKYSFLLLLLFVFPVMVNMDFILGLWLAEVPAYTLQLVLLILANALVDSLLGTQQFIPALMATGKIRKYQIVVGTIIMMNLPISYYVLRCGGGPASVIYVMIIITIISAFVRIIFCWHQIGFSIRRLGKVVWLPALLSLTLTVPVPVMVRLTFFFTEDFFGFVFNIFLSLTMVCVCAWFIALNSSERAVVRTIITKKLSYGKNM